MATIRTASDRILATVEAFGKLKQGDHGAYQSVLFKGQGLPDGQTWRSMKPEQAKEFTRGQQVYLVPTTNKQGKASWDIELIDAPGQTAAPAPTTPPAAAPASGGGQTTAEAYAEYVFRLKRRFQVCHAAAAEILREEPPEVVGQVALEFFRQAQRELK